MDRVLHVHSSFLQQVADLSQFVLGLCDRQSVPGHDNHRIHVSELRGDRLGVRSHHRALADLGAIHAGRAAEPAEGDIGERPVHALAHELGQNEPCGPDQGTGDDQHHVADHESRCARCQA